MWRRMWRRKLDKRIKAISALTIFTGFFMAFLLWLCLKSYPPNYLTEFDVLDDRNISTSSCKLLCIKTVHVNLRNYDTRELGSLENRDVDFSSGSNNVSGFAYPIVPDIVHLILFRKREIDFVQMINIRSIVDNHNPGVILVHCSSCLNNALEGKYWNMLGARYQKYVKVVKAVEPETIFDRKIDNVQHASDIYRLGILMKYGGIYLDNDVYVVRGLHGFRHYEMVLPWDQDQFLGTQVLIAHKDARFLKHWLDSYHNYQNDKWYFNAGEYPTTSVLNRRPELVHRVKLLFGVHMELFPSVYHQNWPEWTNQFTIHLLIRHRAYKDKESPIKEFDENNIKTYNRTYGQMARMMLFGKPDLIDW